MSDQYIFCIDSSEGPYSTLEAAEFAAKEKLKLISSSASGFGASLRFRRAVVAKVVSTIDPTPFWKRWLGELGGGDVA